MYVYLSGPMHGVSEAEAEGWRWHAEVELGASGIETISPLRGKVYRDGNWGESTTKWPPGMILARDRSDVERADALIVYLIDGKAGSGTSFEMCWAYEFGIPIFTVLTPGSPADRPFIRAASSVVVDTLNEAIQFCEALK